MSFWVLRALRKGKNTCDPLPTVSLKGAQEVKNTGDWPRIAETCTKGMISVSPDSHLPIYRKALNSLTCDVWFSYLTIIFWCSDYLPFVRKLLYNLASPLASSEQFSQGSWHTVSPAWSSKNSHGIKHNSQLIGCDYFSSRQGLYEDAIVCMYMNCGCMWWIYV